MINWIKRAWRGWFGPKVEANWPHTQAQSPASESELMERLGGIHNELYDIGVKQAIAAQKNLRLHSIARERNRLKDEIARLKRNKKRSSHLLAELGRLTRLELELEGGK
jgi:hypothetical protein